eukprot:m.40435 g.40435  ORF g.40435 m.40435 type:complete len:352 (-) comp5611_c0_seq3:274-1329(-)
MGGHALKLVETVRKSAEDYAVIRAHVLAIMAAAGVRCAIPFEVPGKTSYGDLDVLYVPPAGFQKRLFLDEHFAPTEVVTNGQVSSFNVTIGPEVAKNFQVDFIATAAEEFEMALFYFSYSDLGGLFGRIVTSVGLKLGIAGLWMDVAVRGMQALLDGTASMHEINQTLHTRRVILTSDPKEMCAFLGLDHGHYDRGFQSATEVFDFVRSCRYFSPAVFTSLNYEHRSRATKRPFYNAFLDHIQVDPAAITAAQERVGEIMRNEQPIALQHFRKHDVIRTYIEELRAQEARAGKFSAALFMEAGFSGPALGAAIRDFKAAQADFDRYLDETEEAAIRAHVTEFCLARKVAAI